MKNATTLVTAFATLLVASTMAASANEERCKAPMEQWQPRETLQQKLEAEGWKIKNIKTEDNCYEVYAITQDGKRVEIYFDPQTLDQIKPRKD
ncbi:PepSY domain-containing protein [Thalassospira australica]|uniref:PepSY domain-containing protein n=1 Tax=Thalassospira australica TaxID=1528106 RepID=UPI00384E9EF4